MHDTTPHPPKRPIRLILLTALLALFQLSSAVRAVQIPPETAARLSLSIPLEVAAGVAWACAFALASVLLVKRRPHALRYAAWATGSFLVYNVARLVIFARADYDRARLPLLATLVAIMVLVSVATVTWRMRSMRARSRENGPDGSEPQS